MHYNVTPKRLLAGLVGVPLLLVVWSLSPLVTVRIGRLRSERIGHYLLNTELSLCETEASQNIRHKPVFDIWFDVPPVSNSQVANMWSRVIRIWPRWLLQPCYFLLRGLGAESHLIESPSEDRDIHDRLRNSPIHLNFLQSEEEECLETLRGLTGRNQLRWVCLHQRDGAYLRSALPNRDWSYHNYRDTPIEDYVLAAEALADLGYWVFRMGKTTEEPLPLSHPRVVDYANSDERSDLLDVFLGARCEFFISSGSGIDATAAAFRRPQLYVNYALPFHTLTWRPDHLFIYQHFADEETGEALDLRELWCRLGPTVPTTQLLGEHGILMTRNSPSEIREVALEMHQRIAGGATPLEHGERHQKAFWANFPRVPELHGSTPFRARIGEDFLYRNPHLRAAPME